MAGISILIVLFLLMIILVSSVTGVVLFIMAIILFVKAKDSRHNRKPYDGRGKAAAILAISIILLLPLVIAISGVVIYSGIQKAEVKKRFEAIEIKVPVQEEEWKKGFDYNGITLVPVNFLMNPGKSHKEGKDLEYIGALVIENSYDYYSFYQLNNESGYKLYYVQVSSFVGGEYYSRTFVDKDEFDAVMDFYCRSDLSASALWKTAPENSSLRYLWESLDLNINDKRDELIKLFHEVLDDISGKKQADTSNGKEYDCVLYNIQSNDGVFSVDLCVNMKEDELLLYINEYKVEEEIVERYKTMLFSLVSNTKTELLQKENGKTAEILSDMAETVSETTEKTSENPAEEDRIDRSDIGDSMEAYLAELDIHPLYKDFLYNEISVPNPFVPGDELSFFDDRDYAQEEHVFEYAAKCFTLVDVDSDGVPELIFRIYSSPDELMYILGIQEDRLVCYDVQETHTPHMSFEIYDNGIVTWGQNYDGVEAIYYSYNKDGSPRELIHFVHEEADTDSGLCYDYYYMDGNETARCSLQSDEEYEALTFPYKGEQPEWFSCDSFADIPKE